MRMVCVVFIAIMIVTLFVASAYAGNPVRKLIRGVLNVGTCPFELLNSEGDKPQERIDMKGYTNTIFNRIWRMGKRALVGVYETATFLFPFPAHYEPVMDDPEFFLGVNRSLGPEIHI